MNYQNVQEHELAWWQNYQFDYRALLARYIGVFSQYFKMPYEIIADVGCGPIPIFIDSLICAHTKVAIDPLIHEYKKIPRYASSLDGAIIHTSVEEEPSYNFDAVFCTNALDHVEHPNEMVVHLQRILKPGGRLFLFVDIDKPPDQMHPHTISESWLRSALSPLKIVMVKIEKSWKWDNYVLWYVGDKES